MRFIQVLLGVSHPYIFLKNRCDFCVPCLNLIKLRINLLDLVEVETLTHTMIIEADLTSRKSAERANRAIALN